jgi:hypothetical protein
MIPKKPVFGKDHAQTRSWGRMTIRRTSHPALEKFSTES